MSVDIHTRSENVYTFAMVGEVRTLISKGGSTDGDGILGCCRGIIACILVIIA